MHKYVNMSVVGTWLSVFNCELQSAPNERGLLLGPSPTELLGCLFQMKATAMGIEEVSALLGILFWKKISGLELLVSMHL